MNDEEIRKAACDAYEAEKEAGGSWLDGFSAVFRAGMEAGRAEAAAKPKRRKASGPDSFGFTRFWTAWPASTRKGGKAECRKIWEDHGLEASELEIFCHVQAMCMTQDWTKDGGAYIPAPAVYLRQKRWDGAEMPAPVATQKQPVESFASQAALARVQRIAPGAARKDAGAGLKSWQEAIEGTIDAGQPRLR